MKRSKVTIDGNEAAAYVAHKINEVIAIYPITPSSPMGEWSDQWSSENKPNIWDTIPLVIEMQSEGGAAGALHGALQSGALATTFTSAQGLLLMIPNMYKIAGELTPTVCTLRRVHSQLKLSRFRRSPGCDGSPADRMAMLASNSVQEVMDTALIAQAASLESAFRSYISSTASVLRTKWRRLSSSQRRFEGDDLRRISTEASRTRALARSPSPSRNRAES